MREGIDISIYIENPKLIEELQLDQIDKWIEETPYAQYLHLLKALKLKSLDKNDPKHYHMAATVVTDRTNLHHLLEAKPLNQQSSGKKKKKKKGKLSKKDEHSEVNKKNDASLAAIDLGGKTQDEEAMNVANESKERILDPEVVEESLEEWGEYTINQESPLVQELALKVKSDEVVSTTVDSTSALKEYSTSTELSEFSEWLLALDDKSDIIDEQRVEESITIEGSAINETLADILAKQGHKAKAIEMYEKLRLINPEKSAYFAAQIQKII